MCFFLPLFILGLDGFMESTSVSSGGYSGVLLLAWHSGIGNHDDSSSYLIDTHTATYKLEGEWVATTTAAAACGHCYLL
jgi:hypothetical protein